MINLLLKVSRKIVKSIVSVIILLPFFRFIRETKHEEPPIEFRTWFNQKILGFNKYAYWPMHHSSIVSYPKNVYVGLNTPRSKSRMLYSRCK